MAKKPIKGRNNRSQPGMEYDFAPNRKSASAPTRTAADILRAQRAERQSYSGPDRLPGGLLGNGDLVQTPNGPVWVPHGEAPPANALEMRARADAPQGRAGMGQPQLDPNSNLSRYRERAMNNGPGAPPMPADFDFPGTYDPNPVTPLIPGYNTGGDPSGVNPFQPQPGIGGGQGPQPGAIGGGAGPQPPPAQPDPNRPPTSGEPFPSGPGQPGGPPNPFDPNVGPRPPIGLPSQPPNQLQGLLAAYGYTTGPNGELLPIHLRQGMSPFQNQPGQQQQPGYTVPGLLGP